MVLQDCSKRRKWSKNTCWWNSNRWTNHLTSHLFTNSSMNHLTIRCIGPSGSTIPDSPVLLHPWGCTGCCYHNGGTGHDDFPQVLGHLEDKKLVKAIIVGYDECDDWLDFFRDRSSALDCDFHLVFCSERRGLLNVILSLDGHHQHHRRYYLKPLFSSLSQFGIAIGVIVSFLILIYPMARPKVKVSV